MKGRKVYEESFLRTDNSEREDNMNMHIKLKRAISGVLSFVMAVSILPNFPVIAEETTELYPYTMYAASDAEGAITINSNNFSLNGNIATNGTIVSSGNMNINGIKTENANEEVVYILEKLDALYFSGDNVDIYADDYNLEDLNININDPMDVYGSVELTGNISLSSGIKAFEDVQINGEVKNTSEAVICSETGDIVITSTNVNFSGLIYAPYGDIIIDTDNLNLNNVIIIGQTITLDCPSINANYSRSMAELVGNKSESKEKPDDTTSPDDNDKSDDIDLLSLIEPLIAAFGTYDAETETIVVKWLSTCKSLTFDIMSSEDNDEFAVIDTITEMQSYQYPITETFDTKYFKVTCTEPDGTFVESPVFFVQRSDSGYTVEMIDSDNDGLFDVTELIIGTDPFSIDTDGDGLTDAEEFKKTYTDPTIYDSVVEGVSDADADSDGDGISNLDELALGTNPMNKDSDYDGLSDYDEVYIYYTDPNKQDTDEDGLDDGSEVRLGLDPLSPETYGIPDAQYQIEQTITTDSSVFCNVNTEDNQYAMSVKIKTNGDAEQLITVDKSIYTTMLENDAQIGYITDLVIPSSCNPESITLKYVIKDDYVTNTLNKYSDYEDLQGVQRLCVFKYFEEINMMLPLDTKYDIENNLIYAEVDEAGIYCVMDLEIWLDLFDVKPEDLLSSEKNDANNDAYAVSYLQNQSVEYAISDTTVERYDAPIDIVFMLQTSGPDSVISVYNAELSLMETVANYMFMHYSDVRVYVVDYKYDTASILRFGNRDYCTNVSALSKGIRALSYTTDSRYCKTWNAVNLIKSSLKLRSNVNSYIYHLHNGNNYYHYSNDDDGVYLCKSNYGIYSQIVPSGYRFHDEDYGTSVHEAIITNGGIDITYSSTAPTQVIEHIAGNIDETLIRTEYDALLSRNLYKITLDAQLSPENNIDTDKDNLTDWQEVDTRYITVNSDGTVILPTIKSLLSEIDTDTLLLKAGDNSLARTAMMNAIALKNVLPCSSDPTIKDTDGDGLNDDIDAKKTIPADSRFSLSDSTSYDKVPEIDFVTERFEQSEANYDSLVENDVLHALNKYGLSSIARIFTAIDVAVLTDARLGGASTISSWLSSLLLAGFDPDETCLFIHASEALQKYFLGFGTPTHYNQSDTCELIVSSQNNIDHLVYNITKAMEYSEQIANENVPVYFTVNPDAGLIATCFDNKGKNCNFINDAISNKHLLGKIYNSVHSDWKSTVGESFGSINAELIRTGNTFTMKYRYYFSDIYEWTVGFDPTDDKPDVGVYFHYFHEMGYAKQYLMDGYFEGTITWTEGEAASDFNVYNQIMETMKEIRGVFWGLGNESDEYYDKIKGKTSYRSDAQ